MKMATTESIKFKKLKRTLKLKDWQVVGVLESLWMFACRNAPEGDVGRWSNEDIAAAMEWDGDADELIAALVNERWLDESEEHRLVIHDWADHAPNWLKNNLKSHGKEIANNGAMQAAKQVAKQPAKQSAEQDAKQAASSLLLSSHTLPTHIIASEIHIRADNGTGACGDKTVEQNKPETGINPGDFQVAWNRVVGVTPIHRMTGKRVKALRVRSRDPDFVARWQEGIQRIAASDFCCGGGSTGWLASVEWFLRPDTLTAILEGKYDNRANGKPSNCLYDRGDPLQSLRDYAASGGET